MLYELLTGTVPFEGDSVVAIALRHLSEPPRPPSSFVPTIPASLDAIVMRALEKSPERRFADADEFLTALEGERERLRHSDGSHTAALAPVAPIVTPTTVYPHPATYTTQAIGPAGPVTGAYGTAPAYWDPNTTGIIPPGSIVLPPGARRTPIWPWVLVAALVAAAAVAALVYALVEKHNSTSDLNVPALIGQPKATAQANLQSLGLVPQYVFAGSSSPKGTVTAQIPNAGTHETKGSFVTLTISTGPGTPASRQVPAVVGLSASTATRQLQAAGFKVSPVKQPSTTIAKNTVIATVPTGGATGAHGSLVVVTISSGPPNVAVPNVVGEQFTDAKLLLQQDRFVVGKPIHQVSASAPGTVLAQAPQSGKAAEGSTVTLTIAQAPPNVTVPQLRGLTQDAASALLGKLGLVPSPVTETRSVNPQYNNVVLSQFPLHGTSVAPGTTVVIRVESYVPPVGPTGPTGPSGAGGPAGASGSSGVG
jgi:serine/threonine-protein kinase